MQMAGAAGQSQDRPSRFVVPPGAASLAKVPKEQRDKAIEASLKTSPFTVMVS